MTTATLEFRCLACGKAFRMASTLPSPSGSRGRCTACGAALLIYPDGRIRLAPSLGGLATASHPADEPIWEIRLNNPHPDFRPGPYRLVDIRAMIVEGMILDNDLARVLEGNWQPVSSFPALNSFFGDKIKISRDRFGDEEHCALHRTQTPAWRCSKCQSYLCRRCVVNRPVIAGGADYFLCAACETEAIPLKGKTRFKGLFKKKT